MKLKFQQKVHVKAILGNIGLFLFIPAFMSLFSICISLIFKEFYSIIPLLILSCLNFFIAYVLYKCFFDPKKIHLWDAMISVTLGWLVCPIFGAITYIWIAKTLIIKGIETPSAIILSKPLNALFEAFSGFTSSGLTMVKLSSELPHILQWFRSFQQWVGGVGLIIFVISLIEPHTEEYQLYFVETKSKGFKTSISKTVKSIFLIYSIFTLSGICLFLLAGMPLWASINHALSAISTGGFTITNDSFEGYSFLIKCISIVIIIFGAMSFSVHYKIFCRKKIFRILEKSSK